MYVLWTPEGTDGPDLHDTLLNNVAPRLVDLDPVGLTIDVDDGDSTVASPVPTPEGEQPHGAVVSIWLRTIDDRGPYEDVLGSAGVPMAGYLVTESLVTDYGDSRWAAPRNWPDGTRSPGVLTVALLERPERIPYEDWVAHWHGVMSPVSAELQPRTRYVRNAVVRPVTQGAPHLDAIVEEGWPSAEDISDPMRFFCASSQEELEAHMVRMIEVVTAFLDMERIRNNTMSEYLLRTPPW